MRCWRLTCWHRPVLSWNPPEQQPAVSKPSQKIDPTLGSARRANGGWTAPHPCLSKVPLYYYTFSDAATSPAPTPVKITCINRHYCFSKKQNILTSICHEARWTEILATFILSQKLTHHHLSTAQLLCEFLLLHIHIMSYTYTLNKISLFICLRQNAYVVKTHILDNMSVQQSTKL